MRGLGEAVPEAEFWQDGQHQAPEAPVLTVTDNPVVGVLYGPGGEVLLQLGERAWVPFGPQPSGLAR